MKLWLRAGLTLAVLGVVGMAAAAEPVTADTPVTVRVSVPSTSALETTLADSAVWQSTEGSALWQSTLQFVRSGRDLLGVYLTGLAGDELQALLPEQWTVTVTALTEDASDFEHSPVVCVGRLGERAEALTSLWQTTLFPRFCDLARDVDARALTHAGRPLYEFRKADQAPVAVAFAHGALLVGNSAGVRQRLDHPVPAVAGSGVVDADPIVATDVEFGRSIRELLAELPAGGKERRELHFSGLAGLRRITCSARPLSGRFHERMALDFGGPAAEGLLGIVRDREPIKLKAAALIPRDYELAYSVTLTDGLDLLQSIRRVAVHVSGPEAEEKLQAGLNAIGAQLALDVEQDVLAQIGPEVFVALSLPDDVTWSASGKPDLKVKESGFLVGLQVKDQELARDIMRSIVEAPALTAAGVMQTTVPHEDFDIHRVTLPHKPNAQVVYALLADFLVFARDVDDVMDAVDALTHKANLSNTELFRGVPEAFSGPAISSFYLSVSPLLASVLPKILEHKAPPLRPFLPVLTGVFEQSGAVRLVTRRTESGIVIEGNTPLPVMTAVLGIAGLDHFGKPRAGRREHRAKESMKKIGKALRKYHRKNKIPPQDLAQLVPRYIDELPGDPFAGYEPFGYGPSTDGAGWILVSVGPDGEAVVDVSAYNADDWQAAERASDQETIAAFKQMLFRFKPKRFADERGYDDEGDIIHLGRWQ